MGTAHGTATIDETTRGVDWDEADRAARALREEFLLDPEVIFLNHGSFGACPRPVFEEYQRWQMELERQPVDFLGRRSEGLLTEARQVLAGYLNVDLDTVVYVTNATSGLNVIARSLPLERDDEVLTTDHEYGALNMTWEWMCGKTGAHYVRHPIPLPVTSRAELVESFWSAVTPRTKVIFLSHITSPTALILPVKEICDRAREAGILTVVDGAHAPSQIPLDLDNLGVDIYSGNNHKWLCAPKGSGFLYARPEHHDWIESLPISWGWQGEHTFITRNQRQGTRDLAPYLATPAAIRFQLERDWDTVRVRCHELAREARRRVADLGGIAPLSPDSPDWFSQMIALPLPPHDPGKLKTRLYDDFHIEAPVGAWRDWTMIRLSFQGYNTHDDLDAVLNALARIL
ncbi:MAG: aminotransferase class V-fold PLP-dependent enzyme [Thermomicrobiales bacterium]